MNAAPASGAPASEPPLDLAVTVVGGPTTLLETGGLRILVDPTFDPPGDYDYGPFTLSRTAGPALSAADIGRVDAVLLSHDQHADNFDRGGRELVAAVPLTLSTAEAAQRIGVAVLPAWQRRDLGGGLVVTAVPARHGPPGCEPFTGTVTGFVIEGPGDVPTVYVSGDNASLDHVREIAERFPDIDVAVLFGGRARAPGLDANLTLSAEEMVEATRILRPGHVVAVHIDSWTHFTEGHDDVRAAFESAGMSGLLAPIEHGRRLQFE
ncbi:MBL fold metallo-hydrolase [Actinomadura rupiterrae]|uniref:MBL fold metallo-hydrolase n=1 Tax=Actinomadura rupiterrae TaxID=559627 RepID=UPI0020A373EB|nr:MBL fold metallo-hydrolase [Actinomadura rupiterrae]MCP2338445.1 L-ascorbate metabolism protein UlaG (beta-lactamase superfamily) [Actinomadura rupiterrae]